MYRAPTEDSSDAESEHDAGPQDQTSPQQQQQHVMGASSSPWSPRQQQRVAANRFAASRNFSSNIGIKRASSQVLTPTIQHKRSPAQAGRWKLGLQQQQQQEQQHQPTAPLRPLAAMAGVAATAPTLPAEYGTSAVFGRDRAGSGNNSSTTSPPVDAKQHAADAAVRLPLQQPQQQQQRSGGRPSPATTTSTTNASNAWQGLQQWAAVIQAAAATSPPPSAAAMAADGHSDEDVDDGGSQPSAPPLSCLFAEQNGLGHREQQQQQTKPGASYQQEQADAAGTQCHMQAANGLPNSGSGSTHSPKRKLGEQAVSIGFQRVSKQQQWQQCQRPQEAQQTSPQQQKQQCQQPQGSEPGASRHAASAANVAAMHGMKRGFEGVKQEEEWHWPTSRIRLAEHNSTNAAAAGSAGAAQTAAASTGAAGVERSAAVSTAGLEGGAHNAQAAAAAATAAMWESLAKQAAALTGPAGALPSSHSVSGSRKRAVYQQLDPEQQHAAEQGSRSPVVKRLHVHVAAATQGNGLPPTSHTSNSSRAVDTNDTNDIMTPAAVLPQKRANNGVQFGLREEQQHQQPSKMGKHDGIYSSSSEQEKVVLLALQEAYPVLATVLCAVRAGGLAAVLAGPYGAAVAAIMSRPAGQHLLMHFAALATNLELLAAALQGSKQRSQQLQLQQQQQQQSRVVNQQESLVDCNSSSSSFQGAAAAEQLLASVALVLDLQQQHLEGFNAVNDSQQLQLEQQHLLSQGLQEKLQLTERQLQQEAQQRQLHEAAAKAAEQSLKAVQDKLEQYMLCQICFERVRDTVLMPCMHFLFCSTCMQDMASTAAAAAANRVSRSLQSGHGSGASPAGAAAVRCPVCRVPCNGQLVVHLSPTG